jgi:hypothetical protein
MTPSTPTQATPPPGPDPARGAPPGSTPGQRAPFAARFMALITEATAGAVARLTDAA